MKPDDSGGRIHDRATRGVALTEEEQTQLGEWYAQQDRTEAAMLTQPAASPVLDALHAQVDEVMVQLNSVTHRIQKLSAENDAVRMEISELQRRLAAKSAAQPA